MKKLEGKIAVVTGATSGMALATAKLFVAEGAYVYITGRRQQQLDEAVAAIGKNVKGILADSSSTADLDRLFDTVKKEKGTLDVLFASAGSHAFAAIGEITEEHFDYIFDINVKGSLWTMQKALPLMKNGGSIILNGSIASAKGFPSFGVYNASKAALRSFVRTSVVDLKGTGIRVNLMSPGPIETGIWGTIPSEGKDQFVGLIPRGKIGQPEEIATAVLFLASEDASFVNGIELFVDGGVAAI
jgi:NAD(P)-dependent dehydrogenase (short-subunit alcohol dehydrogenase family)